MKYFLPLLLIATPVFAQIPLRVIDGPGPTPPADTQTTTTETTTTTQGTTQGTAPQNSDAPPVADANAPQGTISWYMAHPTERKIVIQRCDNDPGHLENDPDCINAKKADSQAGLDNFKGGVNNTIQGAADFFRKF